MVCTVYTFYGKIIIIETRIYHHPSTNEIEHTDRNFKTAKNEIGVFASALYYF